MAQERKVEGSLKLFYCNGHYFYSKYFTVAIKLLQAGLMHRWSTNQFINIAINY